MVVSVGVGCQTLRGKVCCQKNDFVAMIFGLEARPETAPTATVLLRNISI